MAIYDDMLYNFVTGTVQVTGNMVSGKVCHAFMYIPIYNKFAKLRMSQLGLTVGNSTEAGSGLNEGAGVAEIKLVDTEDFHLAESSIAS